MNQNLSGDQFFHGTTANIKDAVRPAWDVGKEPSDHSLGDHGDMSEGDHAFAVRNDENHAWMAAHQFHRNGRRPRVYEVEPAKDMTPGPWHMDHPEHADALGYERDDPEVLKEIRETDHIDEYGSKTGWPVKRRIDIMPGQQGTFPQVNWNRFKNTGHAAFGPDVNHPNDNEIAIGHTEYSHRKRTGQTGPDLHEIGSQRAAEIQAQMERGQGRLF